MSADNSPNTAQAEFWGGDRGRAWVAQADRYDKQLSVYADRLIEASGLQTGERVVDIGCGPGVTSVEAAALVGSAGNVIGLDISPEMLELARDRGAGISNLSFVEDDAQVVSLDDLGSAAAPADVIISRFGVMFFADPVAAFTNIASLSAPGGRLAFACWNSAADNDWIASPGRALAELLPPPPAAGLNEPGPFAFADAERVTSILSEAGWADVAQSDVLDEVYLGGPGSAEDATDFVLSGSALSLVLASASESIRAEVRSTLLAELGPRFDGTGIRYPASARIVTARRA